MPVHAIWRCGLLLTGFLMGASGVAEAKIPQFQHSVGAVPDVMDPNAVSGNPRKPLAVPVQEECEVTKTVTVNFGPLHFQEVVKSTSRICHS